MTTVRILDAVSFVSPAAAKAAGYSGCMNYLAGHNALTRAQVAVYGPDFGIGSLWELNPDAVANGENQGTVDGRAAVAAAKVLGQPKGSAIYAACDTDPASLPGGPAGAIPYYRGFAIAVRPSGYLAGAYIGAAGANACIGAGVIDRVMIPSATSWADGQTPKREDIIQRYPYAIIAGVEYDPDTAASLEACGLWNIAGLWPRAAAPIPPPPVRTKGLNMDNVILVQATGSIDHFRNHVSDGSWWLTDGFQRKAVGSGAVAWWKAVLGTKRVYSGATACPAREIASLKRI